MVVATRKGAQLGGIEPSKPNSGYVGELTVSCWIQKGLGSPNYNRVLRKQH